MQWLSSFICSAALLGVANAAPLLSPYAVKETHIVPRSFRRESDAPAHHLIRMHIGLKQSRFDELERHLYEVSDPDHSRYGQHLSAAEVEELVRPSDEALEAVREWLHQHVEPEHVEYTPAKDFLSFTIPVSNAEALLRTKYGVYRHNDGSALVRAPEWKLPLHLHDHVVAIQPTTAFFRTAPQLQMQNNMTAGFGEGGHLHIEDPSKVPMNATVEEVCDPASITPLCLRTFYGTRHMMPKSNGKNQIGFTNFLGEVNNRSDTEIFLSKFRPRAVLGAQAFEQISVDNGTLQQTPLTPAQETEGKGLEGNLDVQTILGMVYPIPVTAWSVGAKPPPFIPDLDQTTDTNEPYLAWLNFILKQDFIPQVISNSYADDEQTVPESYARTVCAQYAQLGVRGVSVLFGSGDGGVGGVQPGASCISTTTNETSFIPLFPASCPFITTIGGTAGFSPEVAAFDPGNQFATGGGFSNYFARPAYQEDAVKGYLDKLGDEFSGLYNKSGRAYPDFSAYAVNFAIVWHGSTLRVDGTSASTPVAAGLISMLNDRLIEAGKPVLGFMNPWLYKKGRKAFIDVTSGTALGCKGTGFNATEGWDPVTGFGSPRFAMLEEAVGLTPTK